MEVSVASRVRSRGLPMKRNLSASRANGVTHFHINICQRILAPAVKELFYKKETPSKQLCNIPRSYILSG